MTDFLETCLLHTLQEIGHNLGCYHDHGDDWSSSKTAWFSGGMLPPILHASRMRTCSWFWQSDRQALLSGQCILVGVLVCFLTHSHPVLVGCKIDSKNVLMF